jgi:hypothetical protein
MGEGEKAGRVLGEARMAWEIVFPTGGVRPVCGGGVEGEEGGEGEGHEGRRCRKGEVRRSEGLGESRVREDGDREG